MAKDRLGLLGKVRVWYSRREGSSHTCKKQDIRSNDNIARHDKDTHSCTSSHQGYDALIKWPVSHALSYRSMWIEWHKYSTTLVSSI